MASAAVASLPFVEGEVIVRFRPQATRSRTTATHRGLRATVSRRLAGGRAELVRLPAGVSVAEAVEAYRRNPDVEYAEPNRIVHLAVEPSDPLFQYEWALQNTGQAIPGETGSGSEPIPGADMAAAHAWDLHTGDGTVVVALLDSGVDLTHPALRDNLWRNAGEIRCDDGVDDDGDGYVDDCWGWNFVARTNIPQDDNPQSHGTHIAGIVGATGNDGLGTAGVNWRVGLLPLKVLDQNGDGSIADIVDAVDYAVARGARVINASYTYPQSCTQEDPSRAEREAIQRADQAGVLLVAAAGNFRCDNDLTPTYPASYALPNVLSVAASNRRDELASFSSFGRSSVHLAAPGEDILSTVLHTRENPALGVPGYALLTGTSMAAPHVSGLAALLASYRPSFTIGQIREAILQSVDAKGLPLLSGGRVNAFEALGVNLASLPPFQPAALAAAPGDGPSASLTWVDNSTVEDGFALERRIGTRAFELLSSPPADATAFQDTAVPADMEVFYRIKAFNAHGDSPYSNEAFAGTYLAPPRNLSASPSGGGANLTWENASGALEGTTVERRTATSDYVQIATTAADAVEYADQGLTPGLTYFYRVHAFRRDGLTSSFSNEVSVLVRPPLLVHGRCVIAAAAWGSAMRSKLAVLRQFRDRRLLTNGPGKLFVRAYYALSPPLAGLVTRHPWLRVAARIGLAPFVLFAEWVA
jgi:subtilisin family serine protease